MTMKLPDLQQRLGEYFPSILARAAKDADIEAAIENAVVALEGGSLSWARLNQVMHLCSEAGMSEDFYRYYFLKLPEDHPYPVERVFPEHEYEPPEASDKIESLEQFQWGVRRFIYDAMLYWGNFRQAYRDLRTQAYEEIEGFFREKRVHTGRLARRGQVASPTAIPRDDRYLISETACKTYEAGANVAEAEHVRLALAAFQELRRAGVTTTPAALRQKAEELARANAQLDIFELLFEDAAEVISSEEEVIALYAGQFARFKNARDAALRNTRTYLSMCSDLDVYVATSMRSREDFRQMARTCDEIFSAEQLRRYNIRYFDPTLSAASYHEDKGIIECLMVKTSKALLYFAQHKESLGKVSEYAMALSLGKPVIILCPADTRGGEIFQFYRDRHPLIRLIEFETGIVNGAMVTQSTQDVVSLLDRILSNRMEYDLAQKAGTTSYYLLKERLTGSTVRVVSDDRMLNETFWNNYHRMF